MNSVVSALKFALWPEYVIRNAYGLANDSGHPEIANCMIESSIPLAAEHGRIETIKTLIKAIEDPHKFDFENSLYCAVDNGHSAIVRLLLNTGVDANSGSGYGDYDDGYFKSLECTPLTSAVLNEDIEIVSMLLAHGADPNYDSGAQDYTPLLAAAKIGNLQLVKKLLASGADPTKSIDFDFSDWGSAGRAVGEISIYPLTAAIDGFHEEIIRELIGINPECIGDPTSFHCSSDLGLFLGNFSNRAVSAAVHQLSEEIGRGEVSIPAIVSSTCTHLEHDEVREHLDKIPDSMSYLSDIALKAATNGRVDVIRLMLGYKATPMIPDILNTRILRAAEDYDHGDIVKLLIDSGIASGD